MKPDEIKNCLKYISTHRMCYGCLSYDKCKGYYIMAKEIYNYINQLETENRKNIKAVDELVEIELNHEATVKKAKEACLLCQEKQKKELKEAKSEAIKEFAERLKLRLFYECGDINYSEVCDTRRAIDNLVKEMVGENG